MKLRDEIQKCFGFIIPDSEIVSESDDALITKSGMGWNRNTEVFWRNVDSGKIPVDIQGAINELARRTT